jgi:hypothetical protein
MVNVVQLSAPYVVSQSHSIDCLRTGFAKYYQETTENLNSHSCYWLWKKSCQNVKIKKVHIVGPIWQPLCTVCACTLCAP